MEQPTGISRQGRGYERIQEGTRRELEEPSTEVHERSEHRPVLRG